MSNSNPQMERLFSEISTYIERSNELLAQGALIELNSLDEGVQVMCEALTAMTQDQRLQYAGKIQTLHNNLQALGETIIAMRDKLGEEILGTSSHQKASVAYRKGETDKKD